MSEKTYMFVPPFKSILQAVGTSSAEFEHSARITIPTELLKLLLQVAVANSDFNEAGYLQENRDIADAAKAGKLGNPRLHYVGFGFFEGRSGATPEVDEEWYLRTYKDVSSAVASRSISSGAEHFKVIGASEGRSPNASYVAAAEQWKKALAPTPNRR